MSVISCYWSASVNVSLPSMFGVNRVKGLPIHARASPRSRNFLFSCCLTEFILLGGCDGMTCHLSVVKVLLFGCVMCILLFFNMLTLPFYFVIYLMTASPRLMSQIALILYDQEIDDYHALSMIGLNDNSFPSGCWDCARIHIGIFCNIWPFPLHKFVTNHQ